jgi:hypothetical protein
MMVICIVALVVFSVLGIFSAKWRKSAKEAFQCVFKMIQFKPCDVKLEEKIKSKLTSKLLNRAPSLARFFYKNFKLLSWSFTIAFFASLIYSAYGIFNLIFFGSCEPGSSCVISQTIYVIYCYEYQIVYGIIAVLFAVLIYFGYKYLRYKE